MPRSCLTLGAKVLDFCCGNGSIAQPTVQLQPLTEIHLADADDLAVRAVVGAVNVLCEGAPLWLSGSAKESIGDASSALQHDFTKSEEIAQDDRFPRSRFQLLFSSEVPGGVLFGGETTTVGSWTQGRQTELWFDVQRHTGSDAEGSSAVELFRQLLILECPCRIHSLCFPESSQDVLQTIVSRHGVDTH